MNTKRCKGLKVQNKYDGLDLEQDAVFLGGVKDKQTMYKDIGFKLQVTDVKEPKFSNIAHV